MKTEWAATAQTVAGENREVSLMLLQDEAEDPVFELSYLYVGRTTRPTVRTGSWRFDGDTLTLYVEEQDGEPVSEKPISFTLTSEQLAAIAFEEAQFDLETLTLSKR